MRRRVLLKLKVRYEARGTDRTALSVSSYSEPPFLYRPFVKEYEPRSERRLGPTEARRKPAAESRMTTFL